MRRKIERLASSLPGFMNLMLTAAIITLLLVNVTDSWLPWHFFNGLRRFDTAPGAAGSGAFCLFMLAAMLLYVICMGACGLVLAAVLLTAIKRILKLAGR
ncbi:hypothetical protein [Pantoea dispersa]|uniref:hypothetical protein n=1 Tax=Pantoea dispersa TaxID=59814 RepID=UPI000FD820A1|nr:hypothetical protein [Pantoea dispersa]RVU72005.1 hypothetical protein EKH82_24405 [Pantoea dispersa]